MASLVHGMRIARAYAAKATNPIIGDDPDDIAEAWNAARDELDLKTGGELTPRQLDLVADEVLNIWTRQRDVA